ncbi:MAG: RNHCP domain-containing protein [Candidatus Paceibacter sp.]|nr:RNHCP domain-containing protein [Candidatus Paceibacter sp.]
MGTNFKRTIEDFICGNCGEEVKGDGYTNHCPSCLWSKHVDINPGDRAAECSGMMKPAKVETEKGEYVLTHRCVKCGHEKRNKMSAKDNFQEVLKIS